ncbi:hypothetical protein Tco_1045327 [Tanacetum coccineum]|uniref:Uncharacterized protein n=1 Tax=Tanacetum coccineum TaxID=301880 RepID=A0ABQ5GSI7_9ASTR
MIISFNNLCILLELGRNFKHVSFSSIHNIKDLTDIAEYVKRIFNIVIMSDVFVEVVGLLWGVVGGLEREKQLGAVEEEVEVRWRRRMVKEEVRWRRRMVEEEGWW